MSEKRRMTLDELREQGTEALGVDPGLEITLPTGETVLVPSPILVDDAQQKAIEDSQGNVQLAKAIVGDAEHERLLAGGGRSNDVILAWRLLTQGRAADPKPAQ